jgi:hypothetical protein
VLTAYNQKQAAMVLKVYGTVTANCERAALVLYEKEVIISHHLKTSCKKRIRIFGHLKVS